MALIARTGMTHVLASGSAVTAPGVAPTTMKSVVSMSAPASRAASRLCCSSFLGSGVHASSSSVAFCSGESLKQTQSALPRSRHRGQSLVVRGLFGLGVPELAVIAGVAAILFGPKKLPEIGKSLGKTVKSFQQAAKEFESEIKSSPGAVEPTPAESPTSETPVTPVSTSTPMSKPSTSDKDSA